MSFTAAATIPSKPCVCPPTEVGELNDLHRQIAAHPQCYVWNFHLLPPDVGKWANYET